MAIGSKLKGGEVIELVADLGGGKTTFVKGLVRGLGSDLQVTSPTFTLSNEYSAGKLRLHHFDFYRLSEPGIMAAELAEVVGDQNAIIAVEWGEIVENIIPKRRLTIRLEATGEHTRKLIFSYPKELEYLIPKNT